MLKSCICVFGSFSLGLKQKHIPSLLSKSLSQVFKLDFWTMPIKDGSALRQDGQNGLLRDCQLHPFTDKVWDSLL